MSKSLLVEKLHKYSCYRINPREVPIAPGSRGFGDVPKREIIKKKLLTEKISLETQAVLKEFREMVNKVKVWVQQEQNI